MFNEYGFYYCDGFFGTVQCPKIEFEFPDENAQD